MMGGKTYRLVDLFSGCGGISRGFALTGRFSIELGVEIEKHPAQTFAKNFRSLSGNPPHVYQGDISELTISTPALWLELHKANIMGPGEIDVLVGGPPCQGFSRNGTRKYIDREKKLRFYDDPRNHLYKSFLQILDELRPKLVLIENVREFLNFNDGKFSEDLLERLDEIGYHASFKKICAADYGVPQSRYRVFFVAIRKDIGMLDIRSIFPEPCFSEYNNELPGIGLPGYRTVRDAIEDLPPPVYSHNDTPQRYDKDDNVSELAQQLRSASGMVYNHVARVLSSKMLERVRAVGTGRMHSIDPELKTKSFYGSAYGRMEWDEPSLTITTWVYHVGSGRYAHPEEDRAITMREAARLQTFDDNFVFPPLINPVSQMIGNAVPPLLANIFARKFLDILDRQESSLNSEASLNSVMLQMG